MEPVTKKTRKKAVSLEEKSDLEKISLPIVCTRGMVLFPNTTLTLEVGRYKSIQAIIRASESYDNHIVVVAQKKS